ncbi:cytochrome P450 [Acrodontium crateriforme]|uniref:Cytochrome P450 n=1 Tax=Acrodontium crateriforme TaxID=150365 RepID=A0AAQ3MD30_9PEZI|nr:cytochrome P450 [Acrodontium crateriforme]
MSTVIPTNATSILVSFVALVVVYNVVYALYTAYLGPLSRFPGPRLAAISRIPLAIRAFKGAEATELPALHEKYGSIVRIGPKTLSYAGGAQAWNDVHGFAKSGKAKPFKSPKYYAKPYNGADDIFTSNGQTHTRQRKILSSPFSDKALKEQEPMLKRWSLKMKDKLAEKAAANEDVDLLKFYNCTTFDIMGELAFSEGLGLLDDSEYSPWVKSMFNSIKAAALLREFKLFSPVTEWITENILMKTKTIRKMKYEHWRYSTERLDRRLKQTPEHPDLWTTILEKSKGGDGLSTGEHQANAALFMIAGTETTATALSGTTYWLLRSPDKMQKLCDEVRGALKDFDDITLESLAKIKYLQACLQEGLRMYPPVPSALVRVTPKGGCIICGEYVPENVFVGVHHMSTYRSPDHFKNPKEFHPERWLGDPEYKDDHLDAVEIFSVGPRNCLGRNLAWHEMRMLLATMVIHFDLALSKESESWNEQRVFILWEKVPLMCSLSPVKASV